MKNRALKLGLLLVLLDTSAWALTHEGYKENHDGKDASREAATVRINENLTLVNSRRTGGTYAAATEQNDVDSFTFAKMKADGVPINQLCDDATFLRRTSLILTGRLPDPAAVRSFHASAEANKRGAYIDALLESAAFENRWTFWFQEHFGSTPFLIRAGHPLYNGFFENAVAADLPLDQMAYQLLTTLGLTDEVAEANYFGVAGGNTRVSQDWLDNAAIFTSTKLMGVPLECISCHDGAYHLEDINLYLADKQRNQLWEMAAWFARIQRRAGSRDENNLIVSVNLSLNNAPGYDANTDRGDRPNREGGLVTPKYLFNDSEPDTNDNWLEVFATHLISDRQFARFWANRLWGHAFGLAMVEPMEAFDLYRIDKSMPLPEGWDYQVLDPNLLEHMTDQLIAMEFNLKAYLRHVLNSATFQMDSQWAPGSWQEAYTPYYTRYPVHHMTSEEVYDSVVVATGLEVPIRQGYFGGVTAPDALYAHQLVDNEQPRRRQTHIAQFLDSFGRGNRYDEPRSNAGGISQTLMMMNSEVINNPTLTSSGRLRQYIDGGLSETQIITELFMDAYAREPDEEELALMQTQLQAFPNTTERLLTAQWLLLNRVEFTFIY